MLSSTFLTLLCNLHILSADLVLSTVSIVIGKGLANELITNLQSKVSSLGSIKNTTYLETL